MKPHPHSRITAKPIVHNKSYHRSLPSELPSLKLASQQANRCYHSDYSSNSNTPKNSSPNLTTTSSTPMCLQPNSMTNSLISSKRKSTTIPKSDIDGSVLNNQISFDTRINIEKEHDIKNSKKFEPERPNEFAQLFIEKCHEVSYNVYKKENVELKTALFNQLINSFQFPTIIRKMNQECITAVLSSFSNNIFSRALPAISSFPPCLLFDRIENYYDVQWPILQQSYNLLENLLISSYVPISLLQQSITHEFIIRLFRCFASPDSRERQYVKSLLYTIAGRIPERGTDIVVYIKKSFIDAINGEPIHWGLPQILELFSRIIQSVPQFTANSFDDVLEQNLLPLHFSIDFISFFVPITSVVKTLIQRNTNNTNTVIIFLLNHFPIATQKKQMAFLKEIAEIVKLYFDFVSPLTSKALFERISVLYSDECAEIAEESLSLIFSEGFPQLLSRYFTSTVPNLYIRAKSVAGSYWSESVTFAALAAIQEMSRIDLNAFKKITNNIEFYQNKIESKNKERETFWESIGGFQNESIANSNNSSHKCENFNTNNIVENQNGNKNSTSSSHPGGPLTTKGSLGKILVQQSHDNHGNQKGTASSLSDYKGKKNQQQRNPHITDTNSWMGIRKFSGGPKSNFFQPSSSLLSPSKPKKMKL